MARWLKVDRPQAGLAVPTNRIEESAAIFYLKKNRRRERKKPGEGVESVVAEVDRRVLLDVGGGRVKFQQPLNFAADEQRWLEAVQYLIERLDLEGVGPTVTSRDPVIILPGFPLKRPRVPIEEVALDFIFVNRGVSNEVLTFLEDRSVEELVNNATEAVRERFEILRELLRRLRELLFGSGATMLPFTSTSAPLTTLAVPTTALPDAVPTTALPDGIPHPTPRAQTIPTPHTTPFPQDTTPYVQQVPFLQFPPEST